MMLQYSFMAEEALLHFYCLCPLTCHMIYVLVIMAYLLQAFTAIQCRSICFDAQKESSIKSNCPLCNIINCRLSA